MALKLNIEHRKPAILNGWLRRLSVGAAAAFLLACQAPPPDTDRALGSATVPYTLSATNEILLTAKSGEKLAQLPNVRFANSPSGRHVIEVRPGRVKQTIDGIGTSFTESSAFVLAHLDKDKRDKVMRDVYSADGANFSLTRTMIGASDFAVKGKYSYADVPGDSELAHFSIAPDKEGFSKSEYPGIKDEHYDLLPMIKEALAIKRSQNDDHLAIVASAWTAPPWMKDIEQWYIPGSDANNWQGGGGHLKPEYVPVYADYLIRYLKAYQNEGVSIWGLTPVNEPQGNNGQWESMHFTAESQNDFIKNQLGPKLHAGGYPNIRLLAYDQNRDHLEHWADTILGDPQTRQYVYGMAVHWYASTNKVYEEALQAVHDRYPDFALMHTEGTIDDLGKKAPNGINDPIRFQETDWFDNDAFWWNANATDWAYTAKWPGVKTEDHPIYVPVHRYARNIIVSLNHWMTGWIDWNIVLDHNGGPNHVGNFCGAPIMIDTATQNIYYTPIYYVLAQFSRTIRPGDRAIETTSQFADLEPDTIHASATINADELVSVQVLNTSKAPVRYALKIGDQYANIEIAANALQTVRVQL